MMDRIWVMSAFLDLRGFGTWIYRASIPREIKEPFIEGFYQIVQSYLKKNPDIHLKYLGDGFLVIREFSQSERKDNSILKFFKDLKCVTRKIIELIKACPEPPNGVRIRVTEGYAYKMMLLDPSDVKRERFVSEYIEYSINTAERLMEVNPEIVCVVTEGVGKALGRHGPSFRMRKLGAPSCHPKGVNNEDLQTLQVLRF